MVLFNYSTRELTAKVVYYGPGLCGKTTNLQYIHENLPDNVKGKMLSLATKTDRTLFFDFLPIDLGEIRGMKTRVQLYTVPGQVFYNETRKLVLKGADGIVFVADSQETMLGANAESFKNLEENLKGHGMRLADMPHVIQFNKRDLPRLSPIEDLNAAINKYNAPFYESVAVTGIGVQDTLKAIVKLVLLHLTRKYDPKGAPAQAPSPAPTASVVVPAAMPAPSVAAAPVAVPLSRMETPAAAPVARAVPPPPDFRAPAAAATAVEEETSLGRFDEDEIDGIMAEVEDAYDAPAVAPVAAAALVEPVEVAPEPSPAKGDEDSVWMGAPEEDSSPFAAPDSVFGSTLSIDELADAVEAREGATPVPAPAPPPAAARFAEFPEERFEIDRGFDPEWSTPAQQVVEPEPLPEPAFAESTMTADVASLFREEPEAEPAPIEAEPAPAPEETIVLTEVAGPSDLFDDPNLEVANLAPGEAREIVVPVELGEGTAARRFALSIRLRLDPVEPR
ncbi:MAG TPA: GTPase domain-containing protein [Candidatus Polarisedimenticolaceae bacterium]